MKKYELYFATNRNHIGSDQWHPESYGTKFSDDGHENLRFGRLTISANGNRVNDLLNTEVKGLNKGDGLKLADYFKENLPTISINAYEEKLDKLIPDSEQSKSKFGSTGFFNDLKSKMMQSRDVLVYIHGFNVSWAEAVCSALSLQEMFNRENHDKNTMVVLFTWPSEGSAIPYYSYLIDRADARNSGYAVGRGFLKLRDFFIRLKKNVKEGIDEWCEQSIHLLCHSMGNYVLQNSIARMIEFNGSPSLPRLFENIFMCAPDVDDKVLEPGEALGRLNEITRNIFIYYNRQDKAMMISDVTKGNPERLGFNGSARPYHVHSKVNQIDCTPVVPGGIFSTEHSYYMLADINRDIMLTIQDFPQDSSQRRRILSTELPNAWTIR